MKDTFSRNINYMRISITDLCNLRCKYCMPAEGINKKQHRDMISFEDIVEVVKAGTKEGINKVRITGGEPLVKNGIIQLIEKINSIEGIDEIAMTTNGILLKTMGKDLKEAGLSRLNISIDSLKPERYKEITRGGDLNQVLEGIQEVLSLGMKSIKLNVVVIGGFNEDEVEDFARLTLKEHIDVRFIELMPIGEASNWSKERFVTNEEVRQRIGGLVPLQREPSSPAQYYKLPGALGRIGFIDSISNHFCSNCNRIRLTSDGKLKPCLHSVDEIDIMEVLRVNRSDITSKLKEAILLKPEKHNLNTSNHVIGKRNMSEIGG